MRAAAPTPVPEIDLEPGLRVPQWVQHSVFYQILPDRFARSERVPKPAHLEPWEDVPTQHGYKGGDLLGVVERLDHLQSLGITAIYLNPIFQSASNHRYHTHDYLRVDPMLGGDEALRALLGACADRGMKVVLDGVFNHASRGFLQFHDVLENGPSSAYLDWWHLRGFPLGAYGEGDGTLRYAAWWNLPALPKFNTDTPAVREYLLGVAEHWLRFGISGWRLDVPNEIDDAFWRELRRRCRSVDPECYLVGEIWGAADRWLGGDQFDAVMNYELARTIIGFAATRVDEREVERSGFGRIPSIAAPTFAKRVQEGLSRYPKEIAQAQLNLLGSHDTPRVLTTLSGDREAVRLAQLAQFTLPGAPCIYYGDELGLEGGHDPGCRQAVPWEREERWDRAALAWLRELSALRGARPALRTGDTTFVYAHHRVVAYRRTLGEDDLLVALNSGGEVTLHVGLPGLQDGPLRSLVGEGRARSAGGRLHAHLPARRGLVLEL